MAHDAAIIDVADSAEMLVSKQGKYFCKSARISHRSSFWSKGEYPIMKGDRLVLPARLRSELMWKLHSAQSVIYGCIRELCYWPEMSSEITDYLSRCGLRKMHETMQRNEPMARKELPGRPRQTIAVDIFEHAGKYYRVLVDYYTDYFELDQLTSTTTSSIAILQAWNTGSTPFRQWTAIH